jgi:23S rRNA (guanine745-N1)-methyltransferase
MLAETAIRLLRCPLCATALDFTEGSLRCQRGHGFDVARQGYVNLLTGRAPAGAETNEMVAARAEVLSAGHFDVLRDAVAEHAAGPGRVVVDAGAGTGFYLAGALHRAPGATGVALDVAKAAVRRAARAHDRILAAVCDIWHAVPLVDGCADLILNIFAPRNGAEFERVLRPDGALLVVTPRPDHLAELIGPLGLISVDPDKERRLDEALGGRFRRTSQHQYGWELALSRTDAARLVGMGPSAWHTRPAEVAQHLSTRAEPLPVKASVTLTMYARR